MDSGVIIALITAASSLLVAGWTALWTSKQNVENRKAQRDLAQKQSAAQEDVERLKHQLEREAREEDRREEDRKQLRAEMAKYRLPLLEAASDLGHRIENIQHGGFLAYMAGDHPRQEIAVLSTLYRLARYFGTLELLYRRVSYLRFEDYEDTQAVQAALAKIGSAFADDKYDRKGAFYTSRFMIWREEQRAMGEVVTRDENGETDHCVGFATFVLNAKTRDSDWFANFTRDLEAGGAKTSRRLATVQSSLAVLVRLLDEEGRYAEPGSAPKWLTRAGQPAQKAEAATR
jgi:hypothetical protein